MFDLDYTKALYGRNAIHAACQLVAQNAGEQQGQPLTLVVGIVVADLRSEATRAAGHEHELWYGDLVLRPHERFTDGEHAGESLSTFVTDGGLHRSGWRYRIDSGSGLLVPNHDYDRR